MAYSRVLVAVEPNKEAPGIVAKAKAFAPDATFSLLTVVPDVAHTYGSAWTSEASNLVLQIVEGARKQASEQLAKIAHANGIPDDRAYVRLGRPADAVHEVAASIQADCVVAGSHGQHGLGLVFGSTANAVIHGLDCDAYFVRVD